MKTLLSEFVFNRYQFQFKVYRFSISWARILPDGSKLNMKGIEFYSKFIDRLLEEGIEPLVTIYHWDLPMYIMDLGGWTNPLIVDYYREYVDVLFQHLGDRVKKWITFNEPSVFCAGGYGYAYHAPAIQSPGVGDYLCAHHVLIANAVAYRLYKEKYFAQQRGEVGICLNIGFQYPKDDTVDEIYTERAQEFNTGIFANPIFSQDGGYPQVMVDMIGNKSRNEGRPWSRLPVMSNEVKQLIVGTADFLAVNYYSSNLVAPRAEDPSMEPSWWADMDLDTPVDPSWERAKSSWLYSIPQGLQDVLRWVKNKYNNPTVMITENGWSDDGELDDYGRVKYLKGHLAAVSRAISVDGCNIVAYTVWSLTDNFEWQQGYVERFGIHYIDFDSAEKERVPKMSALFFKEFMVTKSFDF